MGMSGVRNLKVWTAHLIAALSLVLLAGVLLARPAHAETFTVNSTNHPGSGGCNATECTLKEAINRANFNGVGDTIGFTSGLSGEIELTAASGGFVILNDTPAVDVRIVGPGGRGVTIDGNGMARPLNIQGLANAAIEGLTIKNGVSGRESGGGIYNAGTLRLTNSTVSGNSAFNGGGIFNFHTGTLTLTNSTVSGNSATDAAGGISNFGTINVSNSTISGNSATVAYSGIYNEDTATLKNTIVANSPSPGGNCGGGITDGGYNLDSDGSCGFGTTNHSLSGTMDNPLNPQLGPLANNGGPTKTHALLAGSPAINKGNSFEATTDQRGVARPQGAAPDIGAFEVDTKKPKVSTATPTGTGIGRGTNVAATFSEKMSPTSITKSTFKLFKVTSSGTTQLTNVTLTLSSVGLKATLNPYGTSSTLLAPRTRYKAVVTTGAKDLAGNALDQNSTTAGNQQKSWTFTTKG